MLLNKYVNTENLDDLIVFEGNKLLRSIIDFQQLYDDEKILLPFNIKYLINHAINYMTPKTPVISNRLEIIKIVKDSISDIYKSYENINEFYKDILMPCEYIIWQYLHSKQVIKLKMTKQMLIYCLSQVKFKILHKLQNNLVK